MGRKMSKLRPKLFNFPERPKLSHSPKLLRNLTEKRLNNINHGIEQCSEPCNTRWVHFHALLISDPLETKNRDH